MYYSIVAKEPMYYEPPDIEEYLCKECGADTHWWYDSIICSECDSIQHLKTYEEI